MPTPRARRVIIVAFAGAQGLDIFGPAEVFGSVGRTVASQHRYEVIAVGSRSGQLPTTCGIPITVRAASSLSLRATDTVLVSGGDTAAVSAAVSDRALVAWIARAASRVRRIGSVCSGAFVLAAAGILDGLAAATHWSACASLARFRPQIAVDRESIFVRAGARGHIWTSAGVTTGIDMALAIVEEDLGREVAEAIQLYLEYDPAPPFTAGHPRCARPEVIDRVRTQLRERLVARRAQIERITSLGHLDGARGPIELDRGVPRPGHR